jgi:DNA segregation ATPase FtsK/SpoIIIE, S-DNA-T family
MFTISFVVRPMTKSYSAYDESEDELPALVRARRAVKMLLVRAGAVALVLLALMFLVAVSSFSISDPSLNTATIHPVENLAGPSGAVIADILLQLFGGAALLVPIPLVLWGYTALRHGVPEATPLTAWMRFASWIGGVLAMAAFASCLPVAASWPFISGMGGVTGDIIAAIIRGPLEWIGLPLIAAGFIAGTIWLTFATILISYACGVRGEYIEAGIDAVFVLYDEAAYRTEQLIAVLTPTPKQETLADLPEEGLSASDEEEYEEEGEDYDEEEEYEEGDEEYEDDDEEYDEEEYEDEDELDDEEYDEEEEGVLVADPAERAGGNRNIIRKAKRKIKARKPRQPEFPVFSAENYKAPPINLLAKPKETRVHISNATLEANARMLESVLSDFGVRGEIINVRPGPVVTLYELEPAAGVKSSRVINLADDIARSMSAIACRVAVVPGRNAIGIELPNENREMVYLREMFQAPEFENAANPLTLSLGKNIGGDPEYADLAKMPHLLIAGTTGSGKSVGINTMILSLLYRLPPDQCKLIMVDPKMLELSVYEGIPHLLAPVVTDPKRAVVALKWTVKEMEERYRRMSKVGVRNIAGFNDRVREAEEKGKKLSRTVHNGYDPDSGEPVYETEELNYGRMPFIVVVIDEVADLMMVAGKDIEAMVQRLAQMARAAGIHLIMATQRPSVDVITGTIKANFPTRISFQVTSKIDSRTILGEPGAEQLLGQGDMLFMGGGGRLTRVHGAFVSDTEVEKIVHHLKKQGKPEYVQAVTEDEENAAALGLDLGGNTSSGDALYDQALAVVLRDRKVSTSYIQRRLSIGYNRAATLIEKMEEEGVISPANHAGKREILIGESAA